jgi:hypothetical protein
LTFFELLLGSANTTFTSHLLLGVLHPADELVASERRDVAPSVKGVRIGDQRSAQIYRKLVDYPTGYLLLAHSERVAFASPKEVLKALPVRITRLTELKATLSRFHRQMGVLPCPLDQSWSKLANS